MQKELGENGLVSIKEEYGYDRKDESVPEDVMLSTDFTLKKSAKNRYS